MNEKKVIEELIDLINNGNAHVSIDKALDGIPFEKIAEYPSGLPYSIWSLTEHLRISQWDIVQFCKSADHKSPDWPNGYWPENKKPSEKQWHDCIEQIRADRNEMAGLIRKSGEKLMEPFSYGDGQTLFKEALVLADHNSYHIGEIIVVRRLLGLWK